MSRGRAPGYTAALLVLIVLSAAIYLRRTADAAPETREALVAQRESGMLARAALAGTVDTVALGDSITEMNALDDLCGTTFNAGVGGATINDLRRFVPGVLKATRPTRIVLAVGTNDVLLGGERVAQFRANYLALLDSLPVRPFALVGVDRGDDAFIQTEANRIGAAYVPPVAKSLTYDGIHPTRAGLKLWRERVRAVCPDQAGARPGAQ
jgi:lysophospholipase L1-like esterase